MWLDNKGYLITQWKTFAKNRLLRGSKNGEKKFLEDGKIGSTDNILRVQEKQI